MQSYEVGLAPRQLQAIRMYPPKQVFAVVSWGCAATNWLARALNAHPDIYCVHCANRCWETLGNISHLDGLEYLRIVASQGHAHRAAGDVHGVARDRIPELREAFGEKFNSVVVTRDPLPRIRSQMALFDYFKDVPSWDLSYLDRIIVKRSLPLPSLEYRNRMFVHAVNMLNVILEEQAVGKIYRCEDLTQKSDVLGAFVQEISGGTVLPDAAWLDYVYRLNPTNKHRKANEAPVFAEWECDVFRKMVRPEAWDAYESLGYERPAFL